MSGLVLGSATIILLIIVAFPLLLLLIKSFEYEGAFSLKNYLLAFGSARNYFALWNTIKLGIATTVLSVLIGAPLAWLVVRTNLPFRNIFRTLFLIPYMIPPFVGAIAWSQLLSPRNGYFNKIIQHLFGLNDYIFNINSMPGLIWVMTLYFFPFVFITTAGALERMDPTLEEVAYVSGAGTFRVMREITLPLMIPSIAGGALLAFVASIANFGIPALIGMPGRIHVLTTRIYSLMYSGGFGGIKRSLALSSILMITAIVGLFFNIFYLKKRQFTIIAGKSMRPNIVDLRQWKIPLFLIACLIVLIIVVAPFSSIFLTSFLKGWGAKIALENFTLENYKYILFEYDLTREAMKNSFLFAFTAATASIFLGSLVAYIVVKTESRMGKFLDILATIPYTIPGTVVAIAMILAWSGTYGPNLYNTFWIILVAYIARYISFAIRSTISSLKQVHDSLEEASRISGAGWLTTFKNITLPLIKPGMIAGWFLIFMPTLRELTMSILLWSPKTVTIGVAVFEMQEAGYFQISAALAGILLIVVLVGNFLIKLFSRGNLGI
jgi:iron(III) transport system permease protein